MNATFSTSVPCTLLDTARNYAFARYLGAGKIPHVRRTVNLDSPAAIMDRKKKLRLRINRARLARLTLLRSPCFAIFHRASRVADSRLPLVARYSNIADPLIVAAR